ncbi:hypothetical protein [Vibrio sp. 10N.239.312.D08]|uniref:hypothetical protein n=1 Tax=Vibrio sp. 10N.239.312.D08 TaxID=3229978 RepID=UPI003551580B
MSSVLIECIRKYPEGVRSYRSLEVDGKQVTLFLSRKKFFPKAGYLMIKGEDSLEVKDVPEVELSQATKIFEEEIKLNQK